MTYHKNTSLFRVLVLPGSLRKSAFTGLLIRAFDQYKPDYIELCHADISKLPVYNQDLELPEPSFLKEFKDQIRSCDGVLIVTPEYNRSIPPVLKNALDWASRPQVAPGTGVWAGRPTAVAGVSPYSLGAFGAVHHLRQVLVFLNMPTMQQPEFYLTFAIDKFDDEGKLIDNDTIKHIQNFWEHYIAFSKKILAIKK